MSEDDGSLLGEKLQDLSRRIEERSREFSDRGMLSEGDGAKLEELRERHDRIHGKLGSAVREGDLWTAMKIEINLDIDSLFEEFTRWENDLEARTMRSGNG
jgi:hypothetical protein